MSYIGAGSVRLGAVTVASRLADHARVHRISETDGAAEGRELEETGGGLLDEWLSCWRDWKVGRAVGDW